MGYTKLDQPETTDRWSIITDKNGYHNYSTISTDGVRYKIIADTPYLSGYANQGKFSDKEHCSYFIFGKKYFSYLPAIMLYSGIVFFIGSIIVIFFDQKIDSVVQGNKEDEKEDRVYVDPLIWTLTVH
jgi:hypothetical protein